MTRWNQTVLVPKGASRAAPAQSPPAFAQDSDKSRRIQHILALAWGVGKPAPVVGAGEEAVTGLAPILLIIP